MRGMPAFIQTSDDLQNLVKLCKEGESGIQKPELIESINGLLDQQFFHVPILSMDGNKVTTRYFYEVQAGSETDTGLTVSSVNHFTPPEDIVGGEDEQDNTPTQTTVTLSSTLPGGAKFLRIYNPRNCIEEHNFEISKIVQYYDWSIAALFAGGSRASGNNAGCRAVHCYGRPWNIGTGISVRLTSDSL